MQSSDAPTTRNTRVGWLTFAAALAVTFTLGILVAAVIERRKESNQAPRLIVPVSQFDGDNAKWGKNFPREYESWLATAQGGSRTKYGGPVDFSHLERDPKLRILFQGYPFEVNYNDDRGHMHALDDVRATPRRIPAKGGKLQPGTCMSCKSSDVPGLMQAMTPGKFYQATFDQINAKVSHPVGCADCHDADTMELRISRPALIEAFAAMGKDITKATHQEKRSLVCAQCHVEYYFAKQPGDTKKGTYLTFPWKHGTTVDAMEQYYMEDKRHVDWVHPVSKTEMIKMQHPDYEVYLSGVHAYRNVACADCHMPYTSEGGVKFTDHHIQSPLKNITNSCGVCHRWSENELRDRVYAIQDRIWKLENRAEDALIAAHREVGAAMQAGATDAQLKTARDFLRRGQLRWDYVASNNGMGFHAPQECEYDLGTAIDMAQEARLSVARLKLPAAKTQAGAGTRAR
jgi:nitrite reductase (cytochrome c-552)